MVFETEKEEEQKDTRSVGSSIGPSQGDPHQEATTASWADPLLSSDPHIPNRHVNNSQSRNQNHNHKIKAGKTKQLRTKEKKDIFDEEFAAAMSFVGVSSLLNASVRALASHFLSSQVLFV